MEPFRVVPARKDDELARWLEVRNAVVPDDPIALEDVKSAVETLEQQEHVLAFDGEAPVGIGVAIL